MIETTAPGKIIISGEYSILFEQPALIFAIKKYSRVILRTEQKNGIKFSFINFGVQKFLSFKSLNSLKVDLITQYNLFREDKIPKNRILLTPLELAQFAYIYFMDKMNLFSKNRGIVISSEIMPNCGLGSSASVILAIIGSLAKNNDINLTVAEYLSLGKEIENLQHGHSSGIDILASLSGGSIYHESNITTHLDLNCQIPFFLVNTGPSSATSFESIVKVRKYFAQSKIWEEFGCVTKKVLHALKNNNIIKLISAMKKNHNLLHKIGVVPPYITDFIKEIEKNGGAGKICGSGSIYGKNGGIILVCGLKNMTLKWLCNNYKFSFEELEISQSGLS